MKEDLKNNTYLEEFLVASATVEDLLDEHFLVWVSELETHLIVRQRAYW